MSAKPSGSPSRSRGSSAQATTCAPPATWSDRKTEEGILSRWSSGFDLSSTEVDTLTEDGAYVLFLAFRWAESHGSPFCPCCGHTEPYAMRRRRFRCSAPDCRKEFSATTGTIFASRKLSFKKIVAALVEESAPVPAKATLRFGRKLDVQYKTACNLRRKIRDGQSLFEI